jgi:hypothetical protein
MSWTKEPRKYLVTGRAERKIWTVFSWEFATLRRKQSPNPLLNCWTQWEKKAMCASTEQPEWLGGAQWARQPEVRELEVRKKMQHPLFSAPRQALLNSPPPLNCKKLRCDSSCWGLNRRYTRECCIYSIPQKWTVLDRESAPQHNPRIGKNDAWWWKSPHQMTSHRLIWWLEGQSRLADFP